MQKPSKGCLLALARGGKRKGAGRPFKSGTTRRAVTWRLPIHLLTRIHLRAKIEGITVTGWVEKALLKELSRRSRLPG